MLHHIPMMSNYYLLINIRDIDRRIKPLIKYFTFIICHINST